MSARAVGAALPRVDGRLKVTGRATYAADTAFADVAHAVIVTSAIARGRIAAIDTAAASRARGVLAVITHENAPRLPGAREPAGGGRVLQLLQDDELHYADQPIAVVVADTLERAQHAAGLVDVRYRAEAAIADLLSNLGGAYAPKTAGAHGPTDTSRGDVEAGLAFASARTVATYTTPIENHHPMEPHATVAVWHAPDRLTVHDATQWVYGVRRRLAELFGLPEGHVRVIDRFVGGAFGCKGTTWSHTPLAALAARVVRRPVKLVLTRPQMCSLVGHRPRTVQSLALGCDDHGRLTAIRHQAVMETSRFDEFVEASAVPTRMLYACPNVRTSHRLVRIDIPTPTFQRAPGEATGTFALEVAMDELAYAAEVDPLQLRLASYAARDPQDDRPWSSKSLRECYRAAADRFGWQRRTSQPRSMRRGRELVGWGMATAVYPAYQGAASARAVLRADGTAVVQSATHDLGTGTYTVMTQIAADALGLPVEAVRFELGDTALPEAPLSAGSMTVASVGSAVKLACGALIDKLAMLAIADRGSPLCGLRRDQLAPQGGALVALPEPARRDPLGAILARGGRSELAAETRADEKPERERYSSHAFGADFVEVRVDEDLGAVRVTRAVAAFAAGRIVNPGTARSQLIGGLVWAIGMALEERTVRDRRTARVVTRDLVDYHVPVAADVPELDVILVEEIDPNVNEIGAKGVGELGITGATAAIANAVYHATGRRIRELPITIEKLL